MTYFAMAVVSAAGVCWHWKVVQEIKKYLSWACKNQLSQYLQPAPMVFNTSSTPALLSAFADLQIA